MYISRNDKFNIPSPLEGIKPFVNKEGNERFTNRSQLIAIAFKLRGTARLNTLNTPKIIGLML